MCKIIYGRRIPIACHDINTDELIRVFESQSAAGRWLVNLKFVKDDKKYPKGALGSIGKCAKGIFRQFTDFKWKYISFDEYVRPLDCRYVSKPLDNNKYSVEYPIKAYNMLCQYLCSFKNTSQMILWMRNYCHLNSKDNTIRGDINLTINGHYEHINGIRIVKIAVNGSDLQELNWK